MQKLYFSSECLKCYDSALDFGISQMSFSLSKKYGHITIFIVYELGLVLS